MKNKLTDLNNHLFAAIERLSDEDLSPEALDTEIARSLSIAKVASQVIANAQLVLDAQKLLSDEGRQLSRLPSMLGIEHQP